MKTTGVSKSLLSAVKISLADQLVGIAKKPFDGESVNIFEKQFMQTIGQSGSRGLFQLFSCNDEYRKALTLNGQRHYRKYFATGRYLTLLGEICVNGLSFFDQRGEWVKLSSVNPEWFETYYALNSHTYANYLLVDFGGSGLYKIHTWTNRWHKLSTADADNSGNTMVRW